MTLDEFKEYAKTALVLVGDSDPHTRASVVITAMQSAGRVMMPSDLEQIREAEALFSRNAAGHGAGSLPRIGQ